MRKVLPWRWNGFPSFHGAKKGPARPRRLRKRDFRGPWHGACFR
jgi:hypothetical protein